MRKIKTSDKQNPVYYEWNGSFIKGKGKLIPLRFFKEKYTPETRLEFPKIEDLKDDYSIAIINKKNEIVGNVRDSSLLPNLASIFEARKKHKYYLVGVANEPMLCNPKKVGTPRWYLIKGQDIYSGNLREHQRGFVMDKIKDCYKPYIESMPVINRYPIRIECEIHDTIKNPYTTEVSDTGQHWDIDNYAYPYLKAFPDLLFAMKKIKDDDRLHLTQPPAAIFCPIDNHEDRKLVFIITLDDREVIKNNAIYQKFHKESFESEDTELVKEDINDNIIKENLSKGTHKIINPDNTPF